MSELSWVDEFFAGLMKVEAVYCGLAVTQQAEHVVFCRDHVANSTVSAAVALGRKMLDTGADRLADTHGTNVIAVRRLRDVALGVVAGPPITESELHRKLNVAAIRAQGQAAKEPASALVLELREAYIASAGPLSNLVFDRAFEPVQAGRKTRDREALESMMEDLARNIAPPGCHHLRDRVLKIFSSAVATGAVRTPTSSAPPPRARSSAPPARPQTVPQLTAVMDVARDVVGPFSDLLVQRALRAFDATGTHDTERFLQAVAAEIPEVKRERFITESRRALGVAPDQPSAVRGSLFSR